MTRKKGEKPAEDPSAKALREAEEAIADAEHEREKAADILKQAQAVAEAASDQLKAANKRVAELKAARDRLLPQAKRVRSNNWGRHEETMVAVIKQTDTRLTTRAIVSGMEEVWARGSRAVAQYANRYYPYPRNRGGLTERAYVVFPADSEDEREGRGAESGAAS